MQELLTVTAVTGSECVCRVGFYRVHLGGVTAGGKLVMKTEGTPSSLV